MAEVKARHLAELEVKRDRTFADLETLQVARGSIKKSMESHQAKQHAINQEFIEQLSSDAQSEGERQQIYHRWAEALQESVAEFNRMADERERLHMQEIVLVRMLAELDYQIKALKQELG